MLFRGYGEQYDRVNTGQYHDKFLSEIYPTAEIKYSEKQGVLNILLDLFIK